MFSRLVLIAMRGSLAAVCPDLCGTRAVAGPSHPADENSGWSHSRGAVTLGPLTSCDPTAPLPTRPRL